MLLIFTGQYSTKAKTLHTQSDSLYSDFFISQQLLTLRTLTVYKVTEVGQRGESVSVVMLKVEPKVCTSVRGLSRRPLWQLAIRNRQPPSFCFAFLWLRLITLRHKLGSLFPLKVSSVTTLKQQSITYIY